ncbi:hypothetical protein P7D79_04780 [Enterococcus avium]|uniref:Uncharacterized protein n=1 Tax=Enterococcus avium TaxID=33945 RepID=A0ABD5F7C8_ENTAV|nr:hypothetical protein [Enterococcus avium]MDT2513536.1 hypothetical protein [Enterococcus avium]MDT2513548.1 hypothetical protein [Enterococcus avium]
MINIKKVVKVVGVVVLFFFLVVLGYVFMPIVMLTSVVMDNLIGIVFQVTILLVFLTMMKLLLQVLTGKTIKLPLINKVKQKLQKQVKI